MNKTTTNPFASILKHHLIKFNYNYNYNNNKYIMNFHYFHSTPVLDRKRRNHWTNSGGGSDKDTAKSYNQYRKKCRKQQSKQELLRNVGAFAEQLFQSWRTGSDDSEIRDRWFRRDFCGKSSKRGWTSTKGSNYAGKRGFDFCDGVDDSDVENMFHGSFGNARFFYCSFVGDENPGSYWSSRYFTRGERINFGYDEEDYDTSSQKSKPYSSDSDRLVLGLCASGPLTIEDVKNAYHLCALKWHPDRHQGETKAVAEEKFKACNAAYQSLCDKLFPV